MSAIITLISYAAFLLLPMQAQKMSALETAIVMALGIGLMLWKKPWKHRLTWSWLSAAITAPTVIYLGFCFYNRWTIASTLRRITALLHASEQMVCILIAVAAVIGTAAASFFLYGLVQQIRNTLCATDEKRPVVTDVLRCLIASIVTVFLGQITSSAEVLSM